MKKQIPYKTYLEESECPKCWYNIIADLKTPLEPMLDSDGSVITKEKLKHLFASTLVEHEFSTQRYIEIPEKVQEIYKIFRATPLVRAYRLENELGTKAHLYYKYEGINPSGSHKLNSAVPQVYYNMIDGIKKLTTETGAGQWGTALAVACTFFKIECDIFMVKISAMQKPQRKQLIETYGGKVYLSPSAQTDFGKKLLETDPECNGNLGIAISEAVESALKTPNAHYALGSVLNHVIMHQTVIGEEAKLQFEKVGEYPDIIISCCGGGSNFGGIAFPFVGDMLRGERKGTRFIGVEPSACPTLTRGKYVYDFGDNAHLTPLMKQYTLGNEFKPSKIHSGGLRYHGMNAIVSKLCSEKVVEATSLTQHEVFDASMKFAKIEGVLPAPESGHSIAEAFKQAIKYKDEEKVILFNVTGHGNFDMTAYGDYMSGKLEDVIYTEEMLEQGFKSIPKIKANNNI